MQNLCDDKTMQTLVESMQSDEIDDVAEINKLLGQYPEDPRLHFLKGSILVGAGNLIEAHQALHKAVEIAPDFAIARFQLGFFQLTSGESNNALKTWARLDALPDEHYLKIFVVGLRHLIRDELEECIAQLREGISKNVENPPLNNDMQLLIDEVTPLINKDTSNDNEDVASATSVLLSQFSNDDTKH